MSKRLQLMAFQMEIGLDDNAMAKECGVDVEIYAAWLSVDDEAEPPMCTLRKLSKLMDSNLLHSLNKLERDQAKQSIYADCEAVVSMMELKLAVIDDDEVPLQKNKIGLMQRIMRGLIKL